MMTAVPKSRLGKRSPFGTLLCAPCPSTKGQRGVEIMGGTLGPADGLGCQDSGLGTMPMDQMPGQTAPFGMEAYWNLASSHPQAPPPTWSASSTITVPRSSPISVDMDKMMAAMVLTSLSCSPIVQSPPGRHPEPAPPLGETCCLSPVHPGTLCETECGGGELSDSGSSGYWSLGRGYGSPAPSPCAAETDSGAAAPPEEALDRDTELFDKPTSRKRKNSTKAVYRCLWPNCGKMLSSLVGAKRHIRTIHLGSDAERSRREEDFYYMEMRAQPDPSAPLAGVSATCTSWAFHSSPASATLPAVPELPVALSGPLSQLAPGRFWQNHSKHQYKACVPVQETVGSSSSSPPCSWTPTLSPIQSSKFSQTESLCPPSMKQGGPLRCRSVSVGELWLPQQAACVGPNHTGGSPLCGHGASRRVRGEAKKCRKVYGIERRELWCTACRWKKACQRFLD